ncbi:metacaspase-3 [Phtheirospermum japonicum]|uniref:Metacaspase-3 n=1 Tax=Phtheirospermum japonicum TaxID=374723 RepID=A0A830CHG0_9LAMI|nr:metacaspase-3 [Phtheirospermum japonicum]
MERRRLSCRWCGIPSLVPLEAQTLHCSACRRVTILQGITNVTNQGYAAHVRPNNQWNMFRVQVHPQYAPAPPPLGRKRALLCGITYKGHRSSLKGSINDVLYMKTLLVERFGFPSPSILVLTEEEDSSRIPTKKNIRGAMRWLVQGCQPGDSLVFHYSGHASQVRDRDGDELDGFDESLLPVDYETEGRILDDEINATIVRPLPRGATLHSIVDTCFSGTFLDLPNVCRINRGGYYKWEDHRNPHAYKGTSGGYAISISACDDHQNSGDTTAFTGSPVGALTYSFVQTLKEQPRLNYGQLLIAMHKKIDAAREEVGLNSNEPHKSQEPLLSSSYKFDIHSKAFTL